jgi:hypothetical protein
VVVADRPDTVGRWIGVENLGGLEMAVLDSAPDTPVLRDQTVGYLQIEGRVATCRALGAVGHGPSIFACWMGHPSLTTPAAQEE